MQHRPITDSLSCGWIRSIEQGLHLFPDEIRHQTSVGFLERYRQHPSNLLHCAWFSVLQEPEERPEGSQPDISRLRGVAACGLQMFQKSADQGRVQLLQH